MKNDVIIDGNFQLVSLEGQPLTSGPEDSSPFTIGKALATILSGSKDRGPFNPVMTWNLCRRLFQGESVSLNADYFDALQIIVEASEQYVVILQGQILEYLEAIKHRSVPAPMQSPGAYLNALSEEAKAETKKTRKTGKRKFKAVQKPAPVVEDDYSDDPPDGDELDEVI